MKVLMNKWVLFLGLLLLGLGAFSFVAYKKTRAMCTRTQQPDNFVPWCLCVSIP